MPRCKSRARDIRARSVQLRHAFEAEIEYRFNEILGAKTSEARVEAMAGMIGLLKTIAADFDLWTFSDQLLGPAQCGHEDFETLAMIAQIVNARLAACTPGSVRRRHKFAR
jgi:hypothetical protein